MIWQNFFAEKLKFFVKFDSIFSENQGNTGNLLGTSSTAYFEKFLPLKTTVRFSYDEK
jgi:hypothetical protein